jgi:membrane-associated protease RseP (regulator of RpoE activity)
MRAWICGLLMLMSGVPGVAACAERRVALIVGNDSYVKISPLHNAANDARRMEQALKAAGFETTVKIDAKRRGLYSAIDAFAAQIGQGRGYLQMGLEWSQADSAAIAKNVAEGGAAARAGIQNGDVLVALDNQKIQSMDDVNARSSGIAAEWPRGRPRD